MVYLYIQKKEGRGLDPNERLCSCNRIDSIWHIREASHLTTQPEILQDHFSPLADLGPLVTSRQRTKTSCIQSVLTEIYLSKMSSSRTVEGAADFCPVQQAPIVTQDFADLRTTFDRG